jgi:DNA-binding GntR family transcriptional regulator
MWVLPGRLEQSATEHGAIMQAIAEGDAVLAAERVREHILSSRQTLLDRLELEQADAGDGAPKAAAAS